MNKKPKCRAAVALGKRNKGGTKTITIWECQDCGALYAEQATCWCCVDMEGQYTGKRGKYEIKQLGTYTAAQIKRLRPFRKAQQGESDR